MRCPVVMSLLSFRWSIVNHHHRATTFLATNKSSFDLILQYPVSLGPLEYVEVSAVRLHCSVATSWGLGTAALPLRCSIVQPSTTIVVKSSSAFLSEVSIDFLSLNTPVMDLFSLSIPLRRLPVLAPKPPGSAN
jgi:hypothetical protein